MANSTRFLIELPDEGADSDQWGNILNNAFSQLEQRVTDRQNGDTIQSNLSVNGTFNVTGNTVLGDALTDTTTVNGNASVTGNLSVNGNNTIGNALTDSHIVNGRLETAGPVQSNIVSLASDTLDLSQGNYFTRTINANATFVFNNPPTGKAFGFVLELNHTSGTVTWPTSVVWPKNLPPTLTVGKTHLFNFVTDDAGARYRGVALVDYTT